MISPKFCSNFCGGCIYLHRFTIPSKINTTELDSHGLLNVEMDTLLLLFLRFFSTESRNVTTFAPCSGHTGLTAAHDTHVFTVQHSRRVSGVQNSSTACYGITPKKSSHFSLARARTLFALKTHKRATQTHCYDDDGERFSGRTHSNLLSHMPAATHARHLLRKCSAKTSTRRARDRFQLFASSPIIFCHLLLARALFLSLSPVSKWNLKMTTLLCDSRRRGDCDNDEDGDVLFVVD